MLITFDENLFLDEYKTKYRNEDSTTQHVKVTSIESIQKFETCNENDCNDVDLRQYIQGITDGMDILIILWKLSGNSIKNKIDMFQFILHNSAPIDLHYYKNMIKRQTYERICFIRKLLNEFDEDAFMIHCKKPLKALTVNLELVSDDNSSKKRATVSSTSL